MRVNFGSLQPDYTAQSGTKYKKEQQAKAWEEQIKEKQKVLEELQTEQARLQAKGLDLDEDDLRRMRRVSDIIANLQRLVKENREWNR